VIDHYVMKIEVIFLDESSLMMERSSTFEKRYYGGLIYETILLRDARPDEEENGNNYAQC
jgi:hypothetical protein